MADAGKVLEDIDGFDKQKLRHVETEEKVVLPNKEGKRQRFSFLFSYYLLM